MDKEEEVAEEEDCILGLVCEDNEEFDVIIERDEEDEEETIEKQPKKQFMGGVDEEDSILMKHVQELYLQIEKVKQFTSEMEKTKPNLGLTSWKGIENTNVAPCHFHQFGYREAHEYFIRNIDKEYQDREREWFCFKIEFQDDEEEGNTNKFIGASNHLQEDIIRILIGIISGNVQIRKKKGEGDETEFNHFSLLQQVGHSFYRKFNSLTFVKLVILQIESTLLKENRFDTKKCLQIETDTIEQHFSWMNLNQGGLNIWNPYLSRYELKWGVSLQYLRTILKEETDKIKYKNWSFRKVFEKILKPKLHGLSLIDYLQKSLINCVNEQVDWFLSPSCFSCNWIQLVHNGGIKLSTKIPKPIIRNDRFVYCDLFLQV